MVMASLSEIVSVGAVLPFLGVLTAPEQVYEHVLIQPLIYFFELTEPNQLILPLTVLFIVAALFAGGVRLVLLYVMTRLSYATGADISIEIYRRTLYQNYSVHVKRNSSEVINGVISKTNIVIGGVLNPILMLISSIILLIGIVGVLFIINIQVALTIFVGFGLLYMLVIRYTRMQLKENGQIIASHSTQMIKSIQEGLGGIRDVLIDGSQEFYCNLYKNADLPFRRASGNNLFISSSPRYVMEAIGMVLIAVIAYFMVGQEKAMITVIPVLGALALGAQRLLPVLQQAYSAYSVIKGAKSSFDDVMGLLDQPLPAYIDNGQIDVLPFKKYIMIKGVSFRYADDSPWVLENINLKFFKGERVGFIGATGSGKSTLLDVVMGLLDPSEGGLKVDGQIITSENKRSWQAHIAHVPQSIYLSDGSIEENIAFGVPADEINQERVEEAAKQAQIAELIKDWKGGYRTFIGEHGVRLSGGQRQRIGIARALYRQADVLIFDEATSALDKETEEAVMKSIECLGKDLTILIIAHRLSTLKGCDRIVRVCKNGNTQSVEYEDIINE